MDIPVVNRIIEFGSTGFNSFHNPSFLSQLLKIYQAYNFWKWGALLLALIASCTTIINRLKIFIVKLRNHPSLSSELRLLSDEDDYSDSDSETSCSLSDDEGEEPELDEEEEEKEETTSYFGRNWRQLDEDFHVRGSGYYIDEKWRKFNSSLRRRRRSIGDLFSWSELASNKNVVKLWDNLGLGLGLHEDIFHLKDDGELFSSGISGAVATSSSPSLIVSAASNDAGSLALMGWDARIGSRIPAIIAEWSPKLGNIVGVKAGGVEKVYVSDDVNGKLTVGDMRKVNSPLENLTENDMDTWWDADAVIVTDDSFGEK